MKNLLLLFMLCVQFTAADSDVDILGLRVYANGDEYRPPIIAMNEVVTIEFDVTTPLPPNLQIVFTHASRNWIPDDNLFVNDPAKVRTDYLAYSNAPNGVYSFTYRYRNSFPNDRNNVAFVQSGNYLFSIIDRDANDKVVARGKFIVGENIVSVTATVQNKYHPELTDPYNQMNFITVAVAAANDYRADIQTSLYHQDITRVDIIQNWRVDQPYRIDFNDRNTETFVEDILKPVKKFWIRNVPLGNEYRRLDLSNTTTYPNHQPAIPVGGPDVSRFQWQGKPDANGASKLKPFTGANAEYLEVEMRLRVPEKPSKDIYVVGGFTNWEVRPEYRMHYDSSAQLFTFRHWLRRGVHDYQYVLGREEEGGKVVDQDWIALEGNDWRTMNRYTVLVYYHDRRLGGFDRVVGMCKARSPGGHSLESLTFPPPTINQPSQGIRYYE